MEKLSQIVQFDVHVTMAQQKKAYEMVNTDFACFT